MDSELLERLIDGSYNEGAEQHSFVNDGGDEDDEDIGLSDGPSANGGRHQRGGPNGRRRRQQRQGDADGGSGGGGAAVVDPDAQVKRTPKDLPMYRRMCGENIGYDADEVRNLRQLSKYIQEKNRKRARSGGGMDQAANDEEDIMSLFENPEHEHRVVKRLGCNLCRYSREQLAGASEACHSAYTTMIRYDLVNTGSKADAVLFQELANVFNYEQSKLAADNEEPVVLRVEEVMQHFLYHDINNPLRDPGMQVHMSRQMAIEWRKRVMASSNDGQPDVMLANNCQQLYRAMKENREARMSYNIARSNVLRALDPRAGAPGQDVIRHVVTSAGAGKWTKNRLK